jgi:aspartyl protease family protein
MVRNAVLIGVILGASASVPILYQANPGAFYRLLEPRSEASSSTVELARLPAADGQVVRTGAREISIPPDNRGHYFGEFRINGRRVEALIDTGATAVAINLSTARRLGIKVTSKDLEHEVSTANGKARATLVQIDRIELGRIDVENVEALVLDDRSLSTTLVGMSFLNRLRGFKVERGQLMLTQ